MSHRLSLSVTFLAVAVSFTSASAQSAATYIARGDKEYAALRPAAALELYEAAITAEPKNVDALWKASRTAVVLGEFAGAPVGQPVGGPLDTVRKNAYAKGERYGRQAVALAPRDANAQFAIAYALGRISLTLGVMARAPYAHEVYQHSTACLKLNPKSAECMHMLGVWHAEAMRVPDGLRTMAIKMLRVQELSTASWDKAQEYLKAALQLQPKRAVHHYDLARIYLDTKNATKAKEEFQATLQAPVIDFNDKYYKAEAKKALDELSKNAKG